MWSKKTHKIADFISLILVITLSLITITYLLDLGLLGKLLALVIASIFIRISYFYFLQKIKIWLKPKKVKKQTITKAKVHESSAEIINAKDFLKSNINDPTLSDKIYSNEAHCIYSYLKSENINEITLNKFIKIIFTFANKKAA